MRLLPLTSRRLPAVAVIAALLIVLGSTVTAVAAAHGGRAGPRRVAPPVAAASRAQTAGDTNPLTLDPPVTSPAARPTVVTIADHDAFGNGPPPATSTVTLPSGHWSQVVLQVTGTETGRQYDRLCEIFDGTSEIFLGVTPEPTPAGISWHVSKDITGYLPLLTGQRTFSTYVDNYLSTVDNGIPVITAKLLFYPAARGYAPAQPASLAAPALAGDAVNQTGTAAAPQRPGVPTQVVPILPSGATSTLGTVNAGQTVSASVSLPSNVTTATLDLYAVGQSTDEFWWGLDPAFREIEVSIDGKPAGVVWPYPYVYTGGVNPVLWKPLTAIHTMDIPSYRLDLTPFAGMLGGTHTITLTVAGNAGYWLAGGSLLLTAGGHPTSGGVTSDSLTFPTTSQVTTSYALGSKNRPVTSESAATSYSISGTVSQDGRTWTDTTGQHVQFGDDQTYLNPSCATACYQWAHLEDTVSGSEVVSGPGVSVHRSDQATWTLDAPNGYLQNKAGTDFFLPASVSQELTDVAASSDGRWPGYRTSLTESITGYGALEENNSVSTIDNGDTTGTVTEQASGGWPGTGYLYQRTVVARDGAVIQDITQPSP